jgi:hypothetical protein
MDRGKWRSIACARGTARRAPAEPARGRRAWARTERRAAPRLAQLPSPPPCRPRPCNPAAATPAPDPTPQGLSRALPRASKRGAGQPAACQPRRGGTATHPLARQPNPPSAAYSPASVATLSMTASGALEGGAASASSRVATPAGGWGRAGAAESAGQSADRPPAGSGSVPHPRSPHASHSTPQPLTRERQDGQHAALPRQRDVGVQAVAHDGGAGGPQREAIAEEGEQPRPALADVDLRPGKGGVRVEARVARAGTAGKGALSAAPRPARANAPPWSRPPSPAPRRGSPSLASCGRGRCGQSLAVNGGWGHVKHGVA